MKVNYGEVLGKIGNGVVEGCKAIFCVGLLTLPYICVNGTKSNTQYCVVGYDDAVKAVVDSGMFSHDKAVVIEAIRKNADTAYYNAIISVVKSSMFSNEKVETIINISK